MEVGEVMFKYQKVIIISFIVLVVLLLGFSAATDPKLTSSLKANCPIDSSKTEQAHKATITRISGQRIIPAVWLIEFEGHRYMAFYQGGIIKLD